MESLQASAGGARIQHACNGGEVKLRVGNKLLKVDGYDKSTNTVYQFHGCYYHGCKTCYPNTIINSKNNRYMSDLYAITLANDKLLQQYYNLVTIWEHDFKVASAASITPPLSLRDAFYGGRTEPIKLQKFFKANGTRGKYIDVCSLYPTVMYYDKYPVGHPTKIYNPPNYDPNWFGMVHCKILPPRGLYLPVLPVKCKTKDSYKLIFELCQECMSNINGPTEIQGMPRAGSSLCKHTDSQRAITGYWTTVEIQEAINQGYKFM
jgi:DNA polymerase type B, organellar and viral